MAGEGRWRNPGEPPAPIGPPAGSDAAATRETRRLLERLGAPPGLCATCRHLRLVSGPRSVFVRCALAAGDRRFPRYPPLPVRHCEGYRPATAVEGRE